jgi:hypothetical protein
MASVSLPSPHSCRHCERLILGHRKRDDELWFTGDSGSRTNAWIEVAKQRKVDIPPDFVLFDVTVAEAREAAIEGCLLCDWILTNKLAADVNDTAFIAARVWDHIVDFGVALLREEVELDKRIGTEGQLYLEMSTTKCKLDISPYDPALTDGSRDY